MSKSLNTNFLKRNGWVRLHSNGQYYFRDPQNNYKFFLLNEALKIECQRQTVKSSSNNTNRFNLWNENTQERNSKTMSTTSKKNTKEKNNQTTTTNFKPNLTLPPSSTTNDNEFFYLYPVFKTELLQMTPDMAAKFLEQNKLNRNISTITVKNYANQMKRGQWRLNGDTIKVGRDGTLYDGQHRLWAVIESGETVSMLVAYGVEEKARPTIDKGRRRSMGDEFTMFMNITRGAKMVAIIRVFYYLESGKSPNILSHDDLVEIFNRHKDGFKWVHETFNSNSIFDNSVIAGAFAFAISNSTDVNVQQIKYLVNQVRTGENISTEDSAYLLRNAIMSTKFHGKRSSAHFQNHEARYRFALKVLRCIQAHLEGEVLKKNLYSTVAGLHYFRSDAPVASCLDVDPVSHKMRKVYSATKNNNNNVEGNNGVSN